MTRLTILHTNDIHGRVPQLLRIATLVRQIRTEVEAAGGFCMYVDAGDAEDTTLLESSLTKGSAMNAILRGAGCEYVALGNAIPIRYGPQAIADMARHFGRPLLCANFLNEYDQLVAGLESFTIHDFGAFKLGIIGATDPWKTYETFFNLHPKKPDDILPALIENVRARGAQVVLLLSHLGSLVDQSLAKKIPGVDIIIGGHDHKAFDPPLDINGTIVAQAGQYGEFLGQLDLEIDPASGRMTHFEGILLPIDESLPPDPEAEAAVEAERVRVQQLMSRVLGTLTDPLDLAHDRECGSGNLLADALLERIPGAEVAFVLTGHWETGLVAGPLTQGTLYAANRSTANPAKVELTVEQIERFLRAALQPENAERELQSLRGQTVGMPHVAGMTVRYDNERLEIQINGQPMQNDRKYLVASTDFELADYVGYLIIPDEQVEYEIPTIMPEVLEGYISKHSPIHKPIAGRVIQR